MPSNLYQATIKYSNSKYKQKRYKGICETTVKKPYANHKKSINLIKSKNGTTLSIEYWSLKQKQQARRLNGKSKDGIRLKATLWKYVTSA